MDSSEDGDGGATREHAPSQRARLHAATTTTTDKNNGRYAILRFSAFEATSDVTVNYRTVNNRHFTLARSLDRYQNISIEVDTRRTLVQIVDEPLVDRSLKCALEGVE